MAESYTRKDAARDITLGVLILLAVAGAYVFGRYRRATHLSSFAQCVTEKHAKMYGAYWCPHCADQKQVFGSAFSHIDYIECGVPGSTHIVSPACMNLGINRFPTWFFADGTRHEGVIQPKDLGARTGCPLP